jgi:hypothetical protein
MMPPFEAPMSAPHSLPRHQGMIDFIDAVFMHLNIGLLIYHVENPSDIASLRLIYANDEASRCTQTDLSQKVGRRIFDAFPRLMETRAPAIFMEVVTTREPRPMDVVEYGDQAVAFARYRTRAFPMPSDCLGVIFEQEK